MAFVKITMNNKTASVSSSSGDTIALMLLENKLTKWQVMDQMGASDKPPFISSHDTLQGTKKIRHVGSIGVLALLDVDIHFGLASDFSIAGLAATAHIAGKAFTGFIIAVIIDAPLIIA